AQRGVASGCGAVLGGHPAIVLVQIEPEIGAGQVAGAAATKRSAQHHPGSALPQGQPGRFTIDDPAIPEVVRDCLKVEADARQLGPEVPSHEQCLAVRVDYELGGEGIFPVASLHCEAWDARLEPAHLVAGIAIVEGRHARRRGDEAEAVEDRAVDGGIENFAEIAVGYGEPNVAVGPGSCAEGLFASWAPTGGDSGPARRSLDDGQQLS